MSRLGEGTIAPEFEATDHFGAPVSLQALRGRKVMLSFYRYASCPLCNLRVNELIRRHPELSVAGLAMIAVFQSPAADIRRHVGRQDAPFPVIADPGMTLYRRFGVETSWKGAVAAAARLDRLAGALARGFFPGLPNGPLNRIPADFLIDAEGRLARCYYGKDASDHLPFEEIEDFLRPAARAVRQSEAHSNAELMSRS